MILKHIEKLFIPRYTNSSYILKQKVRVLTYFLLLLSVLTSISVLSTNLFSPDVATAQYNILMSVIIVSYFLCLVLLHRGMYLIAAYITILFPLLLVFLQAVSVSTINPPAGAYAQNINAYIG